ncbi:MAG: hypothetical protein EPN20_08245 [Magnetospirillum sp.]|nr:MAG: hypothetical protein EPN20_08245 [Magnetospirillum sp.]
MSHDDRPVLSEKGLADAAERTRRQAEALRANLARRKAQSRARTEPETSPCPDGDHTVQDPET